MENYSEDIEQLYEESEWSVYQTLEWKRALGSEETSRHIAIRENEKLCAHLIYFEKEISLPFLGKQKIAFSMGAPLFLDEEYAKKILEEYRQKTKQHFYATAMLEADNIKYENLFKNFHKTRDSTILIDLLQPIETLWINLEKKSIRWAIKKADREKIKIDKISCQKELETFYEIYSNTCAEGGITPHTLSFFKRLCEFLIPKSLCEIFIAKRNDEILGGAVVLFSKNSATMFATGMSAMGLKLQANPALYWHAIKYAKQAGKKNFDMGGYDIYAKEGDKVYSINKFKERWGGKIAEQAVFSTSLKYALGKYAIRNMNFFRNIYFLHKK